jgi:beta-N-acetylhexosaminidase
MSLQERVGQLFLARCDDAVALSDIETYYLGGFLLFGRDFQGETPDSMSEKLFTYQSAAKLPLLIAVDEEGGTVTRVSANKAFRAQKFPSPRSLYHSGGMEAVLLCEKEKCLLLSSVGINVNLAPVCDITTDPNAFLYDRSLGQSPEITADFIRDTMREMDSNKIGSCLKHFPGYGNNADTHTGIAVDSRSLAELESKDLIPFAAGIRAGADAILVSHTIVEALDPDLPASLSPAVHNYLRNTMGFEGVSLTDDLVMQAITDVYGAGEAAVLAVLAGNDLLCSTEYVVQYEAVLAAVLEGRIGIDTLNNAVRNVLEWKIDLGLI